MTILKRIPWDWGILNHLPVPHSKVEKPEKKPNSEFQTPVYQDPITWIGFLWQWCLPFPHIRLWWILSQLTVDASETSGVVNELKSWGSSLVIWCLGLSAYTTVLRFNPWSGNFDPTPSYCTPWPKKKKKIWNIACFVHKRFLYIILPSCAVFTFIKKKEVNIPQKKLLLFLICCSSEL